MGLDYIGLYMLKFPFLFGISLYFASFLRTKPKCSKLNDFERDLSAMMRIKFCDLMLNVPFICTRFWDSTLFFFFLYKNIFYKNIEAEISEILRIF